MTELPEEFERALRGLTYQSTQVSGWQRTLPDHVVGALIPALSAAFDAWVERVAGEELAGVLGATRYFGAWMLHSEVLAAVAPLLAARDRRVEELEGALGGLLAAYRTACQLEEGKLYGPLGEPLDPRYLAAHAALGSHP